jgi:hypothetical protein
MEARPHATVTAFGDGRFVVPLPGESATVADVLRDRRLETAGRRLAINGRPAEIGTGVVEGDEVTLVPRVHGG